MIPGSLNAPAPEARPKRESTREPSRRVEHVVAFLSPAGSTRTVAAAISARLRARGEDVVVVDLARRRDREVPAGAPPPSATPRCLWVGSPVYAQHPIPQVLAFVASGPTGSGSFGVPFATWGAACSGVALHDLAAALAARGYALLGGAKVPAVHSTFWRSATPLGAGHPDVADLLQVEELVDGVVTKLAEGLAPLPLRVFDDQPPAIREFALEASLERAKSRLPFRHADEARCTRCGVCRDACPVGALTLDPTPVFGDDCVLCRQCVRQCPEDAIPFDAAPQEARIRDLAARFGEQPAVRLYL